MASPLLCTLGFHRRDAFVMTMPLVNAEHAARYLAAGLPVPQAHTTRLGCHRCGRTRWGGRWE